jgi:BlaI family penicillinase repressor
MAVSKPSELELQVLAVLWEKGPLTVRQIREEMPDKKKRAYTTMLSVLQGMEKKQLVGHDRDGLAHVYKPLVRRQQVLRPLFRDLLHNVFGGKATSAMQCLLDSADIAEDELQEIKQMLKAQEKEAKAKGERHERLD